MFSGCSKLETVIMPNTITTIDGYAFQNCSTLVNITLSNSVSRIDARAFVGCSNLTNLTIPKSVTYIGTYALTSLKEATYEGTMNEWETITKNAPFSSGCIIHCTDGDITI